MPEGASNFCQITWQLLWSSITINVLGSIHSGSWLWSDLNQLAMEAHCSHHLLLSIKSQLQLQFKPKPTYNSIRLKIISCRRCLAMTLKDCTSLPNPALIKLDRSTALKPSSLTIKNQIEEYNNVDIVRFEPVWIHVVREHFQQQHMCCELDETNVPTWSSVWISIASLAMLMKIYSKASSRHAPCGRCNSIISYLTVYELT